VDSNAAMTSFQKAYKSDEGTDGKMTIRHRHVIAFYLARISVQPDNPVNQQTTGRRVDNGGNIAHTRPTATGKWRNGYVIAVLDKGQHAQTSRRKAKGFSSLKNGAQQFTKCRTR
jgi:hypothetical protein